MNDGPVTTKSHATAWTLAIMIPLLAVTYLLSVPAIYWLFRRFDDSHGGPLRDYWSWIAHKIMWL